MDLTWEAQIDGKKVAYNPAALAYTDDPNNLDDYVKQVSRWFSWRPLLEKHGKKLTTGLKLLISWMLAKSIGYILWMGIMLYFLISGKIFLSLLMFLGDVIIVTMVSLYQSYKISFPLKKVLTSIPYYYTLRIPTTIIFWKSFLFPKRKGW